MTTNTAKRKSSYFVFTNGNGDSKIVGNIYINKNGKSLDIKIGDTWYSAHQPKAELNETDNTQGEGA